MSERATVDAEDELYKAHDVSSLLLRRLVLTDAVLWTPTEHRGRTDGDQHRTRGSD